MAKAPPKDPKAPPKEAEQEPEEGAEGAAAPKAAAKKKMMMLIIIAVALLAVCGGGTFAVMHFLGGDKADSDKQEHAEGAEGAEGEAAGEHAEGEEGEGAKPAHAELTYFPFEPAFLTNFMVNGKPRYLQLSMTVASRDKDTIAALQKHMPLVRNRVVMLLSSEQFDTLRTHAGRETLQAKLMDAVKEILQKETGKTDVDKILFTNYVMQ
jgi:flagellar FliL protein